MSDSGRNPSERAAVPAAGAADAPAAAPPAACWKEIGVYGDGRCAQLALYVHCRNCPVFSAAGIQLLDRPLPPGYRDEWTAHFAVARRPREVRSASAILFRLGQEWLALSTRFFQEIAEPRFIHSLPHRRQGLVVGLVNVRGELLVAVALSRLLGIAPDAPLEPPPAIPPRLLVAQGEGGRLVFPVDEVHGPHRFDPESVRPLPASVATSNPSYCEGILDWRGKTVGLLNAELLFSTLNRGLA